MRVRLRAWNDDFLLSFVRGPDFWCDGCGRNIQSHPNGNPVVRPRRKVKGVVRCEDCLIRLAREHRLPPDGLDSRRQQLAKLQRQVERTQEFIRRQDVHHQRLHRQLAHDAAYIRELERRMPADSIDAAKYTMMRRGPTTERRSR